VRLENRELVGESAQKLRCVKNSMLAREEPHLQEALITGFLKKSV